MTDSGGMGAVVESGCKPIYNDKNQYFLDLNPVNYDICSFVRVVVTSTYMYFNDFAYSLNISQQVQRYLVSGKII
jgi:hypothetical protein